MEERRTLHKLVVVMMSDSPPMPARELYEEVKKQPVNFYEERIRSFYDFDEDYLPNCEDADDDNDGFDTMVENQYGTDRLDPTSYPQGLPLSTAPLLGIIPLIYALRKKE